MKKTDRIRYEMLLRVRDFGNAHRDLFPEPLSGHQAFVTVVRVISEIDAHTTARLIAARETRKDQAARRKVILARLQTIARTSRSVTQTSGALMRLRMPRNQADTALVAEARLVLTRAEAYHDQFVSLGLSTTCLTDLRQALDAFEAAMTDRRLGRAGVASAQAAIEALLTEGSNAARTLDVVVANTAANDPALLAAWERDRRLVAGKSKRDAAIEPSAPAQPDAPAATPTSAATPAEEVPPAAPLRRAS
jgi:hypothetical protein